MLTVEKVNFDISRISNSYTKLIRFFAWSRRFIKNCKASIKRRKIPEEANKLPEKLKLKASKEIDFTKVHLSFKEIKEAEVCL